MGTVTAEQLTNIQMKGRDIWGMLAVIPGVQDTNMNRNFTTWTSMDAHHHQRLPNTSKVVVIDGVNVIDELGTQAHGEPEHRCGRRGAGHLERAHGRERPEQRRADHHDDQVGHEPVQGLGLVQRAPQGMDARTSTSASSSNQAKPLYHVNIPGYSIGGPMVIPKLLDRGKMFFFVSQEFTDDLRPATFSRTNYPTALERQGDFSQTYFGNANGPGQGTLQPIINPDTGQPFPGNKIPLSCAGIPGCVNGYMHPLGQQMLNLLPLPNEHPQSAANNQYNACNSAYDTLPLHSSRRTTRCASTWC